MPFLSVAAISYEGSIFGWKVNELAPPPGDRADSIDDDDEDDDKESIGLEMKMSFGFHTSVGSLKAIAVSKSGIYLVCGGMDERIRIYNVMENKSLGDLTAHKGAVTCLEFFEDSYLFSGSDDCSICIWRVSDWENVHILGGHKASVNDISIHPSGKLALSVSKDNTIKMWNLVQGRLGFTRRLKGPSNSVNWHTGSNGSYYMLASQTELLLHSAADNSLSASISFTSRINKTLFLSQSSSGNFDTTTERMITICENKNLYVNAFTGELLYTISIEGLNGRPRDMYVSVYDISAIKNMTMRQILLQNRASNNETCSNTRHDCVTIVTSNGRVGVFSASSLYGGSSMEESMLCATQIKVEPRITGVVSWSSLNTEDKSHKLRVKLQSVDATVVKQKQQGGDGEVKKSKKRVTIKVDNAMKSKKQKKHN